MRNSLVLNRDRYKGRILFTFLLAFFLLLIDMGSKYLVVTHIQEGNHAPFLYPYGGIGIFQSRIGIDFCINHVRNLGGAWGIFSSYPTPLLLLRIGIISALAIYVLFFNKERCRNFPFLLILVGAFGNIIDFFIYGSVVDMFHFTFGNYSFPVFNVADMMIFFGVATFLIQSLMKKTDREKAYALQSPKR